MKSVDTIEETNWDNLILNDLAFIKKHSRYRLSKKFLNPWGKKTVLQYLFLVFWCFLFIRTAWILIYIERKMTIWPLVFLIFIIAVLICGVVYEYRHRFHFKTILTSFTTDENMNLLNEFLLSQQLVTYRLPGAPEVFQIASKPLGWGKHEQREIMVFIADDYKILISSHFTNTKFIFTTPSRNSRKMATQLKEWLKIYHPDAITITN